MLVSNDCAPDIQTDIPEKLKVILTLANHGGLSEPTEFCFGATTVAVCCYTTISGNGDIMKYRPSIRGESLLPLLENG